MLTVALWAGFVLFVLIMLAIDLGVLNREAHVIKTREALIWSSFCVLLALAFNVAIYFIYENHWLGGDLHGKQAAMEFFTGWLIEQSLSLDNIFVIAMIFGYFHVPQKYQHRTLFWGIIGALVMRGAMIGAGSALIKRFDWIIYVFGAMLILTAIKMLRSGEEKVEPDRNPLVKIARKLYPVTSDFHEQKFFVKIDGKQAITPMFLVLLVIESTDLLFAVDSIPAIFAITKEPFIVFTSNVFAILNLRSMYFVLASAIEKFKYLKPSLVFVLAYVGVKMLLAHHYPIPTPVSMGMIIGILSIGIIASMISTNRTKSETGPRNAE
ncbi:MAG: TerC family protein [Planctomycetes bacterium]|nr:TerC family protein [Planctomycetota bacterium]